MGLKITFEGGTVEQTNFHQYPIVRIDKAPEIDVHFLDHGLPADGLRRARVPAGRTGDRERDLRGERQRVRTLPFRVEGYSV